ncbi:MAG: hypothetical protein AB7S26_05785 [Sandaracinaceae bacterium]
MRRTIALLFASTLAASALVGCGGDEIPPPQPFTLGIRFIAIDPTIISLLNINITPQGTDEHFMQLVAPLTFDENGTISDSGPITYDVATDGTLEIDVQGAHVASRSLDNGDGTSTFDFEMWSAVLACNDEGRDCEISQDSQSRTPAPLVTVVAERAGEVIGDERLFLTQWPLPLTMEGARATIEVNCRPAAVTRCRP